MNLENLKPKLIGSADERAVSPVVGVILMVAIVVILAAVVAAALTGMTDGIGQTEAKGAADFSIDDSDETVTVEVTSLSDAESMTVTGDVNADVKDKKVGDTITLVTPDKSGSVTHDEQLSGDTGTVTVVAVKTTEDGETVRTTVGSQDYDFSG